MTGITELAQSLKAAAEKATQGRWEYYPGNTSIEYNVDSMDEDQGSIVYVDSGDFTQAQTDRNGEFIALANPANILALVEALETEKRICATWRKTAESTSEKLEKAQAAERRWHRVASRVHEQACESDVKIDELEAIRAAAEKLVRCKGRYHSEQNYRALAALFGVNTPDLPPLDDESRAVNVENLQESAYRAGLTAGWNLGLANNNDGFNKCLAAHTAGIKVEAE
ncbi:TPA: ead/Ea22-like family protein [Klebsiella pneumoniae]|uniref:ead/Ea22-like family protein n=1 Tax=Klebsiella pneumoniae TaxID=573 RepID=UPI0022AC9215|nr:ead/Ea22-like family protein [Klebsiella pneumoniae]HBQ5944449.1 ead/Ea22-like family protein [Klebsiella pneumoniae subsp. pneumoniae]MCP6257833.1 ead/Ea22-like family protein [Klebsiella pneumoniae]MCP6744169.1 ead/Ea22-like family protein [Klebsiella pneumoniae]MDN2648228.1 ead/Ea22-like family protein [Klebsiella pneumoniae]